MSKKPSKKPLIVLVHSPSFLRRWMERSLGEQYRVRSFSNSEKALASVRSIHYLDLLITELDLVGSVLGGCNIAREVKQRFPKTPILVFLDTRSGDHRVELLSGMERVRFISKPWDAIFIGRNVATVLAKEGTDEASYE